jgi:type IV secretory pathway VirB2 component (pilin)
MSYRRRLFAQTAVLAACAWPYVSHAQVASTAAQASRIGSLMLGAGVAIVLLALVLIGYLMMSGRGDLEDLVAWVCGAIFILSAPFVASFF